MASEQGGSDALASELAKHGVTVGDLRALLEEMTLTDAYVEDAIGADSGGDLPAGGARKWLDAERSRRGVRILQNLSP